MVHSNLGGRLGVGECAAITLAVKRNLVLAIEDQKATKAVRKIGAGIGIETTASLMVSLIKAGILEVASADSIKVEWETKPALSWLSKASLRRSDCGEEPFPEPRRQIGSGSDFAWQAISLVGYRSHAKGVPGKLVAGYGVTVPYRVQNPNDAKGQP